MRYLRLAGLVAAAGLACGRPADPHLVLITLDTTRADRLGCYGYRGDTSPNLDALADVSVVYTHALATTSWTLPGHATLMTGKLTTSHGARLDPEGPISLAEAIHGPWDGFRVRGVSPAERTLPVLLQERGYATAAVVAGPWLKRIVGLDRGFHHYDDSGITALNGRPAPDVTAAALEWLDGRPRDRPFFLFLNYYDPHGPYQPPRDFLSRPPRLPRDRGFARIVQKRWRYDGEIRFMDRALGRLIDGLRARGLFDDAWIIVTADHGENLGERGRWGHGLGLEQPVLRIPMIVKYPGGAPSGRRNDPVQLSDVFPTVLSRLGIALPAGTQGQPFGRVVHPLVGEVYPLSFMKDYDGPVQALTEGRYKLVARDGGRTQLYDLREDPGEAHDLAAAAPGRAASMRAALERYLAGLPAPLPAGDAQTIDPDTEKALRDLGYLE